MGTWDPMRAPSPPEQKREDPDIVVLLAGKLFDPYTLEFCERRKIVIDTATGLITDVSPYSEDAFVSVDNNDSDDASSNAWVKIGDSAKEAKATVVDLSDMTVLPGFVDAHVHFFLHPYSETPWEDQLTKESLAERTVRAVVHAKRTLLAGFTTVRDLGTEGAGDADIGLRKCLSGLDALIPGPRYFCSNRAIVPTGAYGPKSFVHVNKEGIDGITGAEVSDGRDECIKAVRRQVGAGADWIKIYADYRARSRIFGVSTRAGSDSISTFTTDELQALIDTAHKYGVKVAAHATNRDTISELLRLSVDTIEHGYNMASSGLRDADMDVLNKLASSTTKWVPTLSAYYTLYGANGQDKVWENTTRTFQAALEAGVANIACGGDTGVFPHGDNSLEMRLMVRLGANWKKVLRWATLGGWECVRSMRWESAEGEKRLSQVAELGEPANVVGDNEVPFGAVRKGFAADVIATCGDLEKDFEGAVTADSIKFVMKAGRIFKRDGHVLV